VRTCEGCQFYARKSNLPAHVLQTIPVTWPFAVWGLDIVGPLRKAPGGYTHLLVAIDKFSKWVEAHPITNLRAEQAVTFFTDIVYRFGVPNSIITDNGSQFTGRKFLEFCDKFHIRVDWAAVAHPQTNGQVERANGMILQGLKPRIFDWLNKSVGNGSRSCRRLCGASEPPQAGPPGSPYSSWSMARRPSSPRTWSTGRPEFGATTRTPTSEPARTRWTNSMRRGLWP
jgi:transposase InsO family protein